MAAATMYVTAAGAGAKNGTDWDNAFGLAEWETDAETNAEAGDIYYVKEGTYTLTQDFICPNDGLTTADGAIQVIGVKAETTATPPTFSDWAFGTDRPLIAASSYAFDFDNYWMLQNLRVTTTAASGFAIGSGSFAINCSSVNSSGTSNRAAISSDTSTARAIGCEAESTNGRGLYLIMYAFACYMHDSDIGYYAQNNCSCVNSVIDTCATYGIYVGSNWGLRATNNTIYACGTGIYGTSAYSCIIINNIIDACTKGVEWTTASITTNYFDYNCWDNTTDVTGVTKGNNAVTADPGMNNPAAGDFSVARTSPVFGANLDVGKLTGATV